jgi:predicted transcriptional regulator
MAKVIERPVDKALAAEALRDVPILEMILRAARAGVTREEIKRLLLLSEQEVQDYLNGKETPHRFGLHRK